MESVKTKAKRKQNSKRLTLTESVQKKVRLWTLQVENEFNGMLEIKRNDLLNFIIENTSDQLPASLINRIRAEKFTGKEKAKWIYSKFLEAEKEGQEISFNQLLEMVQGKKTKTKKLHGTHTTLKNNSASETQKKQILPKEKTD